MCGKVLIPLLVDDPLWDIAWNQERIGELVLIPLLVDDPLWAIVLPNGTEDINKS